MTKTQLVEAHQISKNHRYFKECDDLAFRSKNLWNATNYAVRQHYFNTGKHLPYEVVNKQFTVENQPDYRALPAKVSKGTQRLLEKSYKSFFKKSGFRRPPGYLHKTDGRMVVHYEKGALRTTVPGWIQLSKTHLFIKTDRKADFVRIVPKLDYYVIEVGYSVETPAPSETTGRVAAIDLGLNNLATVSSNVMRPIIINGKPVKSMNLYSNKLIAKIQSITEGSSHRLRSYYRKRFNKIKDYLHKASTWLVKELNQNRIDTLVIGKNNGWKQKSKLKNFVQIPYQMFVGMLTYKCEGSGIKVILQEESYTSKSSFYSLDPIPIFGIKNEVRFKGIRMCRGLYKDASGQKLNADLNGSLNILRKSSAWLDDMFEACVYFSKQPFITRSF